MDDVLFNVEIGKRIKTFRCKKQLTQRQLAELVMVSPSCITRLEKGDSMVSIFTMMEIARILDVSIAEILYGSDVFNKIELICLANKLEKCTPEQRKALISNFENLVDIIFFSQSFEDKI